MIKKSTILVALDFSTSALNALELAIRYSRVKDAKVVLLYAIEPPVRFFQFFKREDFLAEARGYAEDALENIEKKYEEEDVDFSLVIREGRPWTAILETATEIGAEMIFMGRSGHQAISEVILGSNTYRVAKASKVPVMVVDKMEDYKVFSKIIIPVEPGHGIKTVKVFLDTYANILTPNIELISVVGDDVNNVKSQEEFLLKEQKEIKEMGFDEVHYKILPGEKVEKTLLDYIEYQKAEADLVILSTDRDDGLLDYFYGDILGEIVSRSSLPVMSLRP
ncbi:MAG: universal stress protein [Bacteroidia bacterium]|nr:universal stress protein [Bacteroidia bacterium]